MANNAKFIADVEAFATLSKEKMLRVAKQSAQDVINIAQTPVAKGGQMPVDDGFLRNGLVVELNAVETARGDADAGKDSRTSLDAVILGIAGFELGDTIRFAWSADYAIARHYMVGVGQGGGLWRDNAAQQWTAVVRKNAAKVR